MSHFESLLYTPCDELLQMICKLVDRLKNPQNLQNIDVNEFAVKLEHIDQQIKNLTSDVDELLKCEEWNPETVSATPSEIETHLLREKNKELYNVFAPYILAYEGFVESSGCPRKTSMFKKKIH